MKFYVNSNCTGCGLCEGTCPAVFSLTGDGVAVAIEDEVTGENEALAMEAMSGCPVSAIESK